MEGLTKFKDWEPTSLDSKKDNYIDWGGSEDLGEWFVGPIKTRDASILEESNFYTALDILGGEGEDVQIHGFGHWAIGHYDLILVKPNTAEATILEDMAKVLEQYPILDDYDLNERQQSRAIEDILIQLPGDLITDKKGLEVAAEVFTWIYHNDDEGFEEFEYELRPCIEAIEKALKALDYHSSAVVEAEHLDKLLADLYPDDCCCETCRTRRLEELEEVLR